MKTLNKISLATFGLLFAGRSYAITSPDITNKVKSPSSSADSVKEVVDLVSTWLLGFAAAIAVLFIIISGLQMITANGNKERYESGKKTLFHAVLGLIIIVLSLAIVKFVTRIPGDIGLI